MNPETPLRKARLAIGLTTSEAGQYVNVTRKTWEAWEIGEIAGKPAPRTPVELFFEKLDRIRQAPQHHGPDEKPRDLVVVYRVSPGLTALQVPIDVVADDNFLGVDDDRDGWKIMKSMAIDLHTGRPYVHRTRFDPAVNQQLFAFVKQHLASA